MNNREAHFYLEELQRMMTQHRGIFSEEFVCANGMAIQALECNTSNVLQSVQPERKNGRWKGRGFGDYECTICWGIVSGKTRYCPHCGADMRGEQDG